MSSAAANITRNYGLDASSTSIIVTISAILLVLVSFAFCLSFVRNRAFARRRRANLALENGGASRGRPGTRGVEEALVKSFPTFMFSPETAESGKFVANGGLKWGKPGEEGGGDLEGGEAQPNWGEGGGIRECAVCLAEYVSGDMLKLLPPCGHVFHVDCIDTWLQGKSTCPICRREIGQNADVKEGDSEGGGVPGDEGEQSERGEQGESSTGGGVVGLEADREGLGQQVMADGDRGVTEEDPLAISVPESADRVPAEQRSTSAASPGGELPSVWVRLRSLWLRAPATPPRVDGRVPESVPAGPSPSAVVLIPPSGLS